MLDKYGSFEDFNPKIYFINEKPMIDFFVEDELLFVLQSISNPPNMSIYRKYDDYQMLSLIEYSKKYISAQSSMIIKFHKSIVSNNSDIVINILQTCNASELYEYIKFLNSEIDSKLVGFMASIFDPEKKDKLEKLLPFLSQVYQRALYLQGYECEYSGFVKTFCDAQLAPRPA